MIIERYISKEILTNLLGISLVLLIIIVGNRFILIMEETVSGAISAKYVFSLLYLNIITQLGFILPFAFYLATLLGLGRLYKDSEMSAMAACGVGQARVIRATLAIATLVGGLIMMISLFVTPWAFEQIFTLQEISKKQTDVEAFKSGEFRAGEDGHSVIYIEDVDASDSQLNTVFARGRSGNKNYVIYAKHGYQQRDTASDQRFLILENGRRYEGIAGQADYTVIEFKRYRLRIEEDLIIGEQDNLMTRSTESLLGNPDRFESAELHWRISLPIATVILGLIAVPLSRTNPRQGRYSKLFVAILIFAAYVNFMAMGKVWMEDGMLPVTLGLWWAHLLALLFGVGLVMKQTGLRWRWQRKAFEEAGT
ncbi:MAG: LPS export ABC transporter permease LptF [Gammaproteobacteria bacterium]|nr:LPS export ABC transporter permease LptF [Gammaproteobacteria bacterium]